VERMVSHDASGRHPGEVAARGPHITIVRPPAISSRFAYTAGVVLPLGPAYLAGALREAGCRVGVVDALGEAPLKRGPTSQRNLVHHGLSIPEIVERIDPTTDAIGLSVMFSQQWPHVDQLSRAIHARLPDRPIFVGGEHPTGAWQFVLDSCAPVTACALGEGEETIVDLAAYVAGTRNLGDIEGIACRIAGRAQRTRPRQRIRNVDDIARPAWDMFPVANYLDEGFTYGVNLGRSMPILATRGCPYQCTFCSSPAMWTTRYYVRDVMDVVDEIESYVGRYAATNVDFYDLTAIIKREWILEFCRELERRRLAITYQLPTGTRSEALDEEVLQALYRTGCRNICYAPESGSVNTLLRIKKKITPERMVRSIRAANAAGIVVKANLMIGFPDETRRDLWQTVRFGMKLAWIGVEDLPLFPFIPYPGSELYDSLRAQRVLPEMSNEYFARLGYGDLDSARSLSQHVSSRQLAWVRIVGMTVFLLIGYLRHPRRVVRTLRALVTGESTTNVELRLVELRRRLVSMLRRQRRLVGRPAAASARTDAPVSALTT
jgi:anaerobic magnesium-protoporphyrin IX monomethyl ester cyclase